MKSLLESLGGEDGIFGIVIFLAGLFSVFCAAKDYDWFMNSSKARLFVKLLGRNGARVFYILLGLVLIGVSLSMMFLQQS